MPNTSELDNITDSTRDVSVETAPVILIIFITLCCTWIILTNMLVFVCLVINRSDLKNFVNLQLLSFSVTDILFGITAIPATFTYYNTTSFLNIEVCSVTFYAYTVSQAATLYHAFSICLHRFVTVHHKETHKQRRIDITLNRIIVHVFGVWVLSTVLVGIPFGLYTKFGHSILECSLNTLAADDYIRFLAIINVVLILPQVGTNVLYICLLRYLCRKWGRINRTTGPKEPVKLLSVNYTNSTTRLSGRTRGGDLYVSDIYDKNRENLTPKPELVEDDGVMSVPSTHYQRIEKLCNNDPRVYQTGCSKTIHPTSQKDSTKISHCDSCAFPKNENCIVKKNVPAKQESKAERDQIKVDEKVTSVKCSNMDDGTQIRSGSGSYNRSLACRKEKDVLCTIGIILILLNIFVTPLNLVFLLELMYDGLLGRSTKFIFVSLALVNSALNPFVYAMKVKPFRDILRRHKANCVAFFKK